MALINVVNLTFAYDGSYDNIFENVTLQIDTDWKLGFIGRNGRGKTTLLHLLMGKYEFKGTISAPVAFDYFPLEVANRSQNTIEVLRSANTDFEYWKLQKELSLLSLPDDVLCRPFETLSHGEQTKALLAILFLQENHFLLIDEPTNHLDLGARKIVSDYLKNKKGFILVSHDRAFLDNCVDHTLSISKTGIEIQKGNFSSWLQNKMMRDDFEATENKKLQRDIQRLSNAARQTAGWSAKAEKAKFNRRNSGVKPDKGYLGHKAAKMMKRSKAAEARLQKAVEEKSGLLKNIETTGKLSVKPLRYHSDRMVEARALTIFYDNSVVCTNVNFTVNRGERIALTGENGSGKSSILKLLVGKNIPFRGELNIGSNLRISYIPQDTSFLRGGLKNFVGSGPTDESLFKAILRKLGFSRVQFEKDIRHYSDGQKKKLLLARSLCEQAHLYIWDEPLNFIDVLSRLQIEELIREHRPTMLFVEHDSSFVTSIATKKIEL